LDLLHCSSQFLNLKPQTFFIMKAWYLIHSKPKQEHVASEQLERQGYRTYLPMAYVYRRRRGRSVRVIAPMFPRYLFISLNDETDDWRPIRSTIGVANLVRFGIDAARVPDDLIKSLKTREDETGIHILPSKNFSIGDKVRVKEGVFEGFEAIIHSKTPKERVVLLMKVIEKYIRVELDPRHLEIKA
jgi:transcriptional antiterminator RfaH